MRGIYPKRALAAVALLLIGGCGGQDADRAAARHQCRASVGFEAPLGSALGRDQLAFARLAVANDNSSHHTRITLAPVDTNLKPRLAAAASDQFAAQARFVAVVGPASDAEVRAVGLIFGRAGLGFISGSATGSDLTSGANPTFFRVVASDALEGPQEAGFVLTRLHPRGLLLIDGQDAYARQVIQPMLPVFRATKVPVAREVGIPGHTPLGGIATRITPLSPDVFLAWQAPRSAEQLGLILLQQRKLVTLVGPDRLYAPGRFTIPGSIVATYAPDITALHGDASIAGQMGLSASGTATAGAPVYAATHAVDDAIAAVCRSGPVPSRGGVLAALRATNEPASILGMPIRFRADGELAGSRWFFYRINPAGAYKLVTNP